MHLIDYSSLLISIGFTGCALAITLLAIWIGTRSESFLFTWAFGALFIGVGAVTFSYYTSDYPANWLAATSFIIQVVGLSAFYGAAWQFRHERKPWRLMVSCIIPGVAVIAIPFALGLSGLGAAVANFTLAALLATTAWEYWVARSDTPTPLIILAILHGVVAASFAICGLMILYETPLVLNGPPQNWAEDVNAVVSLIAISGIGATALALNQSRLALHHRSESMTDVLTGLVNRRALYDAFAHAGLPERTSVIAFDLDHFKAVNDDYGHAVGDQVLQRFTQILKGNLRPTDTAVRLGGEEFVLVLPNCSTASARNVAERIRTRFAEEPLGTDKGLLHCTVSAGIATSGSSCEVLDVLLQRADEALYRAKREGGRNCVKLYSPQDPVTQASG